MALSLLCSVSPPLVAQSDDPFCGDADDPFGSDAGDPFGTTNPGEAPPEVPTGDDPFGEYIPDPAEVERDRKLSLANEQLERGVKQLRQMVRFEQLMGRDEVLLQHSLASLHYLRTQPSDHAAMDTLEIFAKLAEHQWQIEDKETPAAFIDRLRTAYV